MLSAVFDPLDARNDRGLWGFTDEEYAAMTRGQQAAFNLLWLRNFMEADIALIVIRWQEPLDDVLFDHVDPLESAFFALEEEHGALFLFLADYGRGTPEEFIRP